jgi:hypothetical protein
MVLFRWRGTPSRPTRPVGHVSQLCGGRGRLDRGGGPFWFERSGAGARLRLKGPVRFVMPGPEVGRRAPVRDRKFKNQLDEPSGSASGGRGAGHCKVSWPVAGDPGGLCTY